MFLTLIIKQFNLNDTFIIILLLGLVFTILYAFQYSKNEIYKVCFNENKLTLFGKKYNTDWKEYLLILDSNIKIRATHNKIICNRIYY